MKRPFQVKHRAMVSAFIALAALSILTTAGTAWAQMVNSADTARKGHDLATVACSNCHQVAVDQRVAPLLVRPAASMPNPYLLEYQIQEVVTYILSLRK
jgi:mono/diheme cytochrome c family protein